jgi:hypothetical protein
MVSLVQLWLPILLSAVIVFVVSTIIHMALRYHRADYRKVPAEDGLMESLRKFDLKPGDYVVPCPATMADMKNPEFVAKKEKGPVLIMTVVPSGMPKMGPQLLSWFFYLVLVSILAAYVTGRALGPGAHYLKVFRFAGCTAFVAYAIGLWQDSIWYGRSWATTFRYTIDGLIYGLMTAGTFGWLWPR